MGRIKDSAWSTPELHADGNIWGVVINVVADEIYESDFGQHLRLTMKD